MFHFKWFFSRNNLFICCKFVYVFFVFFLYLKTFVSCSAVHVIINNSQNELTRQNLRRLLLSLFFLPNRTAISESLLAGISIIKDGTKMLLFFSPNKCTFALETRFSTQQTSRCLINAELQFAVMSISSTQTIIISIVFEVRTLPRLSENLFFFCAKPILSLCNVYYITVALPYHC